MESLADHRYRARLLRGVASTVDGPEHWGLIAEADRLDQLADELADAKGREKDAMRGPPDGLNGVRCWFGVAQTTPTARTASQGVL